MPKMKVWWIPQIPMKAFEVEVETVAEGKKLMGVLADYDAFQYENNVKPDYANMGGLSVLDEEGEWCDWSIYFENLSINGVIYNEFFEEMDEFLDFLKEVGITEEQLYSALDEQNKPTEVK